MKWIVMGIIDLVGVMLVPYQIIKRNRVGGISGVIILDIV
jgi:hypothetical protein